MKYDEFAKMDEQGSSHWWYSARRELLKNELKKISAVSDNLKLLDLASGCGYNFAASSDYGKAFGIDISWHAINYCKEKNIATMVQGDAQNLPFKSGSYDVVLALDIFEHLEDDALSMKEIGRVLKEKGRLIFNVPASMPLFSYHDTAFHHYRRYNARGIKRKLNMANLQINFMSYWSFFIYPCVYILRKLFNRRKRGDKEVLSDFHRRIPSIISGILKFFNRFELFLIKRKIYLPVGASLFGTAQKSNEHKDL